MGKPQSGWVNIGDTELNRIDFLYKLTTAKAKMEKVTLIPGETKVLFLDALSKEFNLNKEKLETYYKHVLQTTLKQVSMQILTMYLMESVKNILCTF